VSSDSSSDKTATNVSLPAGSSKPGSRETTTSARPSSSDSPSKSAEERLRFVKHKGHVIFLIDLSHCQEKELLFLLDQVRNIVARHAQGSMLTLGDFTGAEIDKKVFTRLKEVLVMDRPYVKRSAWVGAESVPQVFYEHIKSFSQRELPVFKTREEAMDWLVAE
jgi:hypothetical protein